jgi:hypothetical protein
MAMMLSGRTTVGTVSLFIRKLRKCNFTFSLSLPPADDGSDESEAESGSGSGSGIDDEDSEGSGEFCESENGIKSSLLISTFHTGMPHYPEHPEQPITPPYSPIDTSSSDVIGHGINRNNIDDDHSSEVDPDITKETEDEESNKTSSSTSSSTWKTKRLIITYFLPLVMAWFGGSISSAISELL